MVTATVQMKVRMTTGHLKDSRKAMAKGFTKQRRVKRDTYIQQRSRINQIFRSTFIMFTHLRTSCLLSIFSDKNCCRKTKEILVIQWIFCCANGDLITIGFIEF